MPPPDSGRLSIGMYNIDDLEAMKRDDRTRVENFRGLPNLLAMVGDFWTILMT